MAEHIDEVIAENDPFHVEHHEALAKAANRMTDLTEDGGRLSLERMQASPGTALVPQAPFLARASTPESGPIVVPAFGTSQVEGNGPTNWTRRLSDCLQAGFPLPDGSAAPAIRDLDAILPTLPGIQFINAGVSGSLAAGLIAGGTQVWAEALAPLAALVIVWTGTNDWEKNTPVATFKSDLKSEIDPVRALSPNSTWLFIFGNERLNTDTGGAYSWEEYGQAIREVADEHPETSIFLDLHAPFKNMGVHFGGSDPLDLIVEDGLGIHLTPRGDGFVFEAIRNALALPNAPLVRATDLEPAAARLASDSFSGDDTTPSGRVTDGRLGGSIPLTAVNAPDGSAQTLGGALTKGSVTGNAIYAWPAINRHERYSFTLKKRTVNTSGTASLSFVCGRADDVSGALPGFAVTLGASNLNPPARMSAVYRDVATSTSNTLHSSTLGTLADGDRITVERNDSKLSIYLNGRAVLVEADSGQDFGLGYWGFTWGTVQTAWEIANVTVDTPV